MHFYFVTFTDTPVPTSEVIYCCKPYAKPVILVKYENLQVVDKFTYLGGTLTMSGHKKIRETVNKFSILFFYFLTVVSVEILVCTSQNLYIPLYG